jgi:hypothetical protein
LGALLFAALLLVPGPLGAQDFGIDWFGLAGGGGSSSGGDFELASTIGQPDAGSDMLGGDFVITGGFWSIAPLVQTSSPPALSVTLDQGSVVIAWPANGSAGFNLEEATALATPSSWTAASLPPQASNGTNTVRLPLAVGSRFYRLHKP